MIEIATLGQMLALVNSKAKVTVIDFYADWCGPCQAVKPDYERMSAFYEAHLVCFAKCNVDRASDCARHFSVRAMPTFLVCVGGEVVGRVTGTDLGVVQRYIDIAVTQVKQAARETGGRRLGSGPGSATGAAAGAPRGDAFAEQMFKLKKAVEEGDLIQQKDSCSAAYKLLWESCALERRPAAARHPFGVLLFAYLATDSFSVSATSALFHHISMLPAPECYDGDLIVNQCLRYAIQLLSVCTWNDVEMIRLFHTAVLALLQVPETQQMVVRSIYFHDECISTGMELESSTLLGAFFSVGPYPKNVDTSVGGREQTHWEYLLKTFPPTNKDEHAQTVYFMQQAVETLAMMNKRLADALLQSPSTRDVTLRFFGRALALNEDYVKTMRSRCPVSSEFFMIQLQSTLVEVALPLFARNEGRFDPSTIPASYLLDDAKHPNGRAIVNFGKDIERIAHYDDENPLPTLHHELEPYNAAMHLFFLAARAITLCAAVLIDEHEHSAQSAGSPAAPQRQRDASSALCSLYEGLLGSVRLGESRIQYLNGLAHWLLYIMGVNENGELPPTPPEEWNYLPQGLVDCVIRAAKMAPINSLYIDKMISLMLVLMGNTQFFPKPHTHALFPGFLLRCMRDGGGKHSLEGHPWFSRRIVRACIDCFVAVEKCPYERVQVRYELSHCIMSLLKYDSLCDPVREDFKKDGTVLERFSHMAVAEVNESVDQLIDSLSKMNAMVKEGADLSENTTHPSANEPTNNEADGGDNDNENENENEADDGEGEAASRPQTYHELGVSLQSHIFLFKASMGMFIELCNQFPRDVSQNLVAQQISQMLARSLVAFAGPQSSKLKIEHAQRYDFNPREILSTLVDCLTRFRRTSNFLKCMCNCGVSLEEIRGAMNTVIHRRLVSEELTWKLSEMLSALEEIKQGVDDEETLWDDAPDFALDALLSTPLSNPVALPAEIKDLDDLVYVNRDTIHHVLLSESKHPFTKEFLDEAMVDAFNKRPDVARHRDKLVKAIKEWLEEAKRKRLAEKATTPSGTAPRATGSSTGGAASSGLTRTSPTLQAREEEDADEVRWY